MMRLMPSHVPLTIPYFITASTMYLLQVGVYLHEGGVRGEMQWR